MTTLRNSAVYHLSSPKFQILIKIWVFWIMATTIAKAVVGSKVKGMTKGLGGKENVSAHV